jgi:hypothetical protein
VDNNAINTGYFPKTWGYFRGEQHIICHRPPPKARIQQAGPARGLHVAGATRRMPGEEGTMGLAATKTNDFSRFPAKIAGF